MITGWIEKSLGELFDFSGGFSASRADLSTKGYPYLHYGDIHGSKRTFIDVCVDGSIPQLDIDLNKVSKASLLNNGDIVFVDASEDDEGASRHIVVRNEKNMPFISGLHTIVAKSKNDELDNRFREFCFQSVAVKSQFKFYAVGTKVTGISKSAIRKITLYYPKDKAEQRRIAELLSDTDALIAAMEKLIAKKRVVKQGTMQELLTGKRRLPGFSGEWEERPLEELLKSIPSKPYQILQQEINGRGSYPVVSQSDSFVEGYSEKKSKIFFNDKGVIIFGDHTLVVKFVDFNFIVGADGVKILIAPDVKIRFMYYVVSESKKRLDMGYARHYNQLLELRIMIPIDKKEQTAIAEILSDMDAEIEALTTKLNKLRNIKQGMMSELLTGRIRLPEQKAVQNNEKKIVAKSKIISFPNTNKPMKKHNQAIEDAVILGVITDLYATNEFPLAPFYAQKFPYLLHRHIEGIVKGYNKLAAGPYNSNYRYRTARPIALKNQYVIEQKTTNKGISYLAFLPGKNILEAKTYFAQWHGDEPLEWLEQFRYLKPRRDKLELLTTVDMAMVELRGNGDFVNVLTVKGIIQKDKNWKEKLTRDLFSDENIARAIDWSNKLFGQGN